MRRRNLLSKIGVLALMIIQLAGAVTTNDLRFAVIWNSETTNDQAPVGWNIGDAKTGDAPEIGLAQLKMFLSSLDPSITTGSTLDTNGMVRTKTDDSGVFGGKLKNVRIYTQGSNLTLDAITSDFGGKQPDAIVYINAGSPWGDDDELVKLLRDAAAHNIGVMTIGDASVTDAKAIDTTKTIFPIMGVQNEFRFKSANDDIISEFNFMTDNDDAVWDRPDTVQLVGIDKNSDDVVDSCYILRLKDSKQIYRAKVASTGVITGTPWKDANFVKSVDVLYAYGEWSIKAKAVEVIDNDLYAPEMTTGIYNNHDLILVSKGTKIFIAKADWGSNLWANGTIFKKRGDELTGVSGKVSGSKFIVDKDYYITASNYDDGAFNDSILVIKSGTEIPAVEGGEGVDASDELKDVNGEEVGPVDTYLAGGYKDLKIMLSNTNSQIYGELFPKLKGKNITELPFKQWSRKDQNGRIRCAADIWAFNNKVDTAAFDRIYTENFDRDKYYVTYLGDQVAGDPKLPHFVQAPESQGDFDKAADMMRDSLLGYDKTGKLYHAVAAVQKEHRRLVILGFQPTYLKDAALARDLLSDAAIWIGVDDYRLPTPQVIPMHTEVRGDTIPATLDSVKVVVDFTTKGDNLKKQDYKLEYRVVYDKDTKNGSLDFSGKAGKSKDSLFIDLSDLGIVIDPKKRDITKLEVYAVAKPKTTPAPFDQGDENHKVLVIRKLAKVTTPTPATFVGTASLTLEAKKDLGKSDVANAQISYKMGTGAYTKYSSAITLTQSETVTAFAEKAGYVDADDTTFTFKQNSAQLPKPVMTADTSVYPFTKDLALNFELETYKVNGMDVKDSDYNLSFKASGMSIQIPDTGKHVVTPVVVDSLIRYGKADALTVNDARAVSENDIVWSTSEPMKEWSCQFRTLKLEMTASALSIGDSASCMFTVKDPVTNAALANAKVYYKIGSDFTGDIYDHKDGKAVDPGTSFTVANEVKVYALAFLSGYKPAVTPDGLNVTVDRKAVDLSGGAAYFDKDGDGAVDSAEVYVDEIIIPDSLECRSPFGSDKVVFKRAEINSASAGTKKKLILNFTKPFAFDGKTGFSNSKLISAYGVNYNTKTDVETRDSVAPVIVSASVVPSEKYNNGKDKFDRLTVKFSEEMNAVSLKVENPFTVYVTRSGAAFTISPKMVKDAMETVSGDEYRFAVELWDAKVSYPLAGDSINISSAANIKDSKDFVQSVKLNKKVILNIQPKPVTVDLIWLELNQKESSSAIWDKKVVSPKNASVQSDSAMILFVLDPKRDFTDAEFAEIKVEIAIYDQIGNKVLAEKSGADGMISGSALQGSVATVVIADTAGVPVTRNGAFVIAWNLRNDAGRKVGVGAYKVIVNSRWPGGLKTDPISKMVNVRK